MKYKELIEAHGLTLHGDIEHFAELVAAHEREAAIIAIQKRFTGDLNREDMEVRRCIADLQKHFGVEE